MRRRIAVAISVALVAAVVPLLAQTSATRVPADPRVAVALEVVRVWLEGQRAYDQIPGVSAAVVYDQDPLWTGGYGFADLTTKRAADGDTVYSICSISKLFTSVAAMQLRDAGKLRLDDPVAKHLQCVTAKLLASRGTTTTIRE